MFSLFNNFFSYIFSFILLIVSHYKRKTRIVDLKLTNENKDINIDLISPIEKNSEIDKFQKRITFLI